MTTDLLTPVAAEIAKHAGRRCRVAIAGGPNTGKTTLAQSLESIIPVVHTDWFKGHSWNEQPELIMAGLSDMESFLVEGVQVARCLRKGLEVDIAVFLTTVHEPITIRQRALSKGIATIFRGWLEKKPEDVTVLYL